MPFSSLLFSFVLVQVFFYFPFLSILFFTVLLLLLFLAFAELDIFIHKSRSTSSELNWYRRDLLILIE